MSPPLITMPKTVVVGAVILVDKNGNPVEGNSGQYATVAASQTKQALGTGGGAKGDVISRIVITPGTTSPGKVSIFDGSGSEVIIFNGGATSVVDLKPFELDLNLVSASGAWQVTTGANVTVVCEGNFT